MRVKQKSAWYAACYGASNKRVKLVLKNDNPRVPARQIAKALKSIEYDFRMWSHVH